MDELELLKEAARERWGEDWTIRQQHYADGTTSQYAFRSCGRNEDGHIVRDRLFLDPEGEAHAQRVLVEKGGVVEVLEREYDEDDITSEVIYVDDAESDGQS